MIIWLLDCLLNEIQIRPGESLRRGQTEYTCLMDKEGMIKLIEKTRNKYKIMLGIHILNFVCVFFSVLHDFCLPGNQNESLLEQGRCPGKSVGCIMLLIKTN